MILQRSHTCAALGVLGLLGLVLGVAPRATAQVPISFGAQVSYADDADLGLGVHATFGTGVWFANTRVVAGFDFYFPGSTERDFDGIGTVKAEPSFWEINLDWHYLVGLANAPAHLYFGGGLHVYDGSVDLSVEGATASGFDPDGSGVGLNLLGGVEFDLQSPFTPFAQLKIEVGGAEQVVISAGLRF